MARLAQGIPGFDLDIPLTLQVGEKLVHQAPGYLHIVGHLLAGDGIPEEGMLEQKLNQQTFGQAQVFKSLGHGGIGVDKRGQDLRFHQVEIQEMLGQVTAGFFLPEQGRSQLFGLQNSGFNYSAAPGSCQSHLNEFHHNRFSQTKLDSNHRQSPG